MIHTGLAMLDVLRRRESPDFRPLTRAMKRWFGWLVAATVIGGAGSFVLSKSLPPEYESTAQLYLTPASNSSAVVQDVVLGQNLARTYVSLVTADVVLQPAMDKIGWADISSFRNNARVSQVRDTSVMSLSFRNSDPQRAAAAANAIAASFIEQSRKLQSSLQSTTSDKLDEQVQSLQKQLLGLDDQIAQLQSSLAATPSASQADKRAADEAQLLQLETSRAAKRQTLTELANLAEQVRLVAARQQSTVTLWQPAVPALQAVSPRVGLNTLLGALGAGLIAILAIAAISYLDDRLIDLDDVRSRLGITALGEVRRAPEQEMLAGQLAMRDAPASATAEAFRSLRTNVSFANVDRNPRLILVTSAQPGEGKTLVSANLALAFAQAGTPTVLVDADLRRSAQRKLFKLESGVGLTDLVVGSARLTTLEPFRVASHLFVIHSGPLPPNPAEVLSSNRMFALLQELAAKTEGGMVIVDTSPILAVTDPIALAPKVDGCLLVVDSSQTPTRSARRAIDSLRAVHAVIIGAVLNKVEAYGAFDYGYPSIEDAASHTTGGASERQGRATM